LLVGRIGPSRGPHAVRRPRVWGARTRPTFLLKRKMVIGYINWQKIYWVIWVDVGSVGQNFLNILICLVVWEWLNLHLEEKIKKKKTISKIRNSIFIDDLTAEDSTCSKQTWSVIFGNQSVSFISNFFTILCAGLSQSSQMYSSHVKGFLEVLK